MINKLKVKNYKSLKDLELRLKSFNVLVGPNAGGKSNIIDALAFLTELVDGGNIEKPLKRRGSFDKVVYGGRGKEIEFSSEFTLKNFSHVYSIAFNHEEIVKEGLTDEVWREGQSVKEKGSSSTSSIPPRVTIFHWEEILGHPSSYRSYQFFKSFRFYQFIPSEIRKVLPVKGALELERSGGNLAQVLHTLHSQHEEVFQRIEDLLRQGIPEIEKLRAPLVLDKGETYVAVKEKGLEADFHQVSDGTLKLLAFITAVSMPEPVLLCFEEPENFIHARLQKLLVEILKKSGKQVILSTHHPYLVDFVEPEEVIIVEKEEGETKACQIKESDKLKKRLEELELRMGEYYYSGALGGVP